MQVGLQLLLEPTTSGLLLNSARYVFLHHFVVPWIATQPACVFGAAARHVVVALLRCNAVLCMPLLMYCLQHMVCTPPPFFPQ